MMKLGNKLVLKPPLLNCKCKFEADITLYLNRKIKSDFNNSITIIYLKFYLDKKTFNSTFEHMYIYA